MDSEKAGRRIRLLREKAGETQEELGAVVGVTGSSICQYEAGLKTPRDDVKIAIAKHYNRSVAFIFFRP